MYQNSKTTSPSIHGKIIHPQKKFDEKDTLELYKFKYYYIIEN